MTEKEGKQDDVFFSSLLEEASKTQIKIIAANTPEALLASTLLIVYLQKKNTLFSLFFTSSVKKQTLKEASLDSSKTLIFLGFTTLDTETIEREVKEKKIILIGELMGSLQEYSSCKTQELNTSFLALLYKILKEKESFLKDYAALPIILARIKKQNLQEGIYEEILRDALLGKKIKKQMTLEIISSKTLPLSKALEWSIHPFLPGITGSSEGVMHFLSKTGINVKKNEESFRSVLDLSEEELKSLLTNITLHRMGSEETPLQMKESFFLLSEAEEDPLRDSEEMISFLYASIYLRKQTIAIGKLLKNRFYKNRAVQVLKDYREKIIEGLNWFYEHRKSDRISIKEQLICINAASSLSSLAAPEILALIASSNLYTSSTFMILFVQNMDATLKICINQSGQKFPLASLTNLLKGIPYISQITEHPSGTLYASLPEEKEEEVKEALFISVEALRVEEL